MPYPKANSYPTSLKARLGRNLGRSSYGLADDAAWADTLAGQQLELNRLDWQAQQAAHRGLIQHSDYQALRAENHANTLQRLMLGLGTKAEDTTGGAWETLGDVLSLGSYAGASFAKANIETAERIGFGGTNDRGESRFNLWLPGGANPSNWGAGRKAFLDAWQGRTDWSKLNREYEIAGAAGSNLNFGVGLAADIFLDPTTYMTFGVSKGLKVAISAPVRKSLQSAGRLGKIGEEGGHLSGFGYEIYKRAANRMQREGLAKGQHLIDDKSLGKEGINRIATYAVEHFDDLRAEYLADLTKGKWAAIKSVLAPGAKANQARVLQLGEKLGVKIGGFGVDDMFQESASFLGKERGSTLLPEVISAGQKNLAKLPVAGKLFEGFFDTFDHGWDVAPEILEEARITRVYKDAEYAEKVSKYQTSLGSLTQAEREQVSEILEARSRFEEVGKGTLASAAEYDPRLEEAANFLKSEMDDIFRLEQEAGIALNKVEDYVAHIVNPRVQKYYLDAIAKNGEINLVGASKFSHQRMIASLAEGEDLFGEGVFKKDAFEILVARKRASIEMLTNKEFLGKVVQKYGVSQAIVHAVAKEGRGLTKGVFQGWARRAGYGVHQVIKTDQVFTAEHGAARELGFVDGDTKGNIERVRYLNRPNDTIIREPGKGLSGKYSPEGEAEAARLNLPQAARLHYVEKVKGLEVERHPIPENLSWRPLKLSQFDLREGMTQGGRHKVANDMPKLKATTVLEALDDPDHPLWEQVLRGRVGTTGADVYGEAAEAERLYGVLGYLNSYTTRWLDAPLVSLVPDVYERALAVLKKHGKETPLKETKDVVSGPSYSSIGTSRADDTTLSAIKARFNKLGTFSISFTEVSDVFFSQKGIDDYNFILRRIKAINGIGDIKVKLVDEFDWAEYKHSNIGYSTGFYDPVADEIVIRSAYATDKTILHESVHAAVYNIMNQPLEALSKKTQAAINDMYGLYNQAVEVHAKSGDDIQPYGISNVHEFVAEALSNSRFQQFLRNIPYEEDYGVLGKIHNLWDSFVARLGRILGFSDEDSQSVLAKTFEAFDTIAKENPKFRKAGVGDTDYPASPPIHLTEEEKALAKIVASFANPIEVRKVRPALPQEVVDLAKATRKAAGIGTDDAPVTPFLSRQVNIQLARLGFSHDMAKQLYRALFDGEKVTTVQQADAVLETLEPILGASPVGALTKDLKLAPRLSDDIVPVNVRLARQVEKNKVLPSRYDQDVALPVAEGKVAKKSTLGQQLAKETEETIAKGGVPEERLRFADRPGKLSSRAVGKLSDEAVEGTEEASESAVVDAARAELLEAQEALAKFKSDRTLRKRPNSAKYDRTRIDEKNARTVVKQKIAAFKQIQQEAVGKIQLRSSNSSGGGLVGDARVASGETTSDRLARLRQLRSMADGMVRNTKEADAAIARLDKLIQDDPTNAAAYLDSKAWLEQLRSQLPTDVAGRKAAKINFTALDAELTRLRSELASGNLDATPSPTKGTRPLDTRPVDEVVYLPASVAKYLDAFSAPGIDPAWPAWAKKTLRRWDQMTQLWKTDMLAPFPAYHGRNFMTNASISVLKGGLSFLDPSDNFARGRATMGMVAYSLGRYSDWPQEILGLSTAKAKEFTDSFGKMTVTSKTGRSATVAELFDDMKVRGIIHGMQRAELAGQDNLWGSVVSGLRGGMAGSAVGAVGGAVTNQATGTEDSDSYLGLAGAILGGALGAGFVSKGLRKVGASKGGVPMMLADGTQATIQSGWKPFLRYGEAATEMPFRTHLFLNEFVETGSMSQAADAVYRYMGDYHALSPFERRILRRVIPFYGWMKTAFKNSAFQLIEGPGNLAAVMKLGRNWNIEHDVDPEDLPDYLHAKFSMVVGQADGTKPYAYYTPGVLPIEEVTGTLSGLNFFPGMAAGGDGDAERREFFASVASKANFPALAFSEFVTGVDAFSGKQITESPGTKPNDWDAAPAYLQALVGYEPARPGKEAVVNNPKIAWVLGKMPASRFITLTRQIQELDPEARKQLDTLGMARHFLGVGAVRVDPNSQRYFYNEGRIRAMKNLLDHVIVQQLGEPPSQKKSSFRYKRR